VRARRTPPRPLISDNTNSGKAGVGTTTPLFKLDVLGSINAGAGLCFQGDCKFTWAQVAGNPSLWSNGSGGANIYYLGGNVGIGTNNPFRACQSHSVWHNPAQF
jgi:hypothetical protein